MRLSIGMSTYDDFDGVYFTVQSLRLHHEIVRQSDVEIIVLDNNPSSAAGAATRNFMGWVPNGRYIPYEGWKGTATRTLLFEELAQGEIVISLDSHVLLQPGALESLLAYYENNPQSLDLIQGPMLYDDLRGMVTHMEPIWRAQMWGIWGYDQRGQNVLDQPFEIPMHGLGLFACRREAWLGFNHAFQGFGAEEGYIHEKYRQAGHKTLCLPGLRWLHRFPRPAGIPFPALLYDKIRNYFIGHRELGLDVASIHGHFSEFVSQEELLVLETQADDLLANPPQRPEVFPDSHPVRFIAPKLKTAEEEHIIVIAPCEVRELPCSSLGEATGETKQCPTCRGNVQVKLMNCAVRGTCTVGKEVEGISCCQSCPDYQSSPDNYFANSLFL